MADWRPKCSNCGNLAWSVFYGKHTCFDCMDIIEQEYWNKKMVYYADEVHFVDSLTFDEGEG